MIINVFMCCGSWKWQMLQIIARLWLLVAFGIFSPRFIGSLGVRSFFDVIVAPTEAQSRVNVVRRLRGCSFQGFQ